MAHRRAVVALVMQLLIWFVDSNIQNSVSASIFGALYGPIFPACLSMANDLLPSKVHMVSMTIMYGAPISPHHLKLTFIYRTAPHLQALEVVRILNLYYRNPE